jgi:hypothetical protein
MGWPQGKSNLQSPQIIAKKLSNIHVSITFKDKVELILHTPRSTPTAHTLLPGKWGTTGPVAEVALDALDAAASICWPKPCLEFVNPSGIRL